MSKIKLPINIVTYKHNYAILDIESFNDIDKARPYEIALNIYNKKHELLKSYSLLLKDVFLNPSFQENCFYKDKLPCYYLNFYKENNTKFGFYNAYEMVLKLNEIIEDYNIKLIIGYNIMFDYKAINRLYEDVNNSIRIQKKNFKVFNIPYKNISKLVHNNFKKLNCFDIAFGFYLLDKQNKNICLEYGKFCLDNNYLSDSGLNISTKEDTRYKFFIDTLHNEFHMGFEDIKDEKKLYDTLRQFAKTKRLNINELKLNTGVPAIAYKNGIYSVKKLQKELY